MNKAALLFGSALIFLTTQAFAQSPLGKWKSVDDKTGDTKAVVNISEQNGRLVGVIESLYRKPDEDPHPVCDQCEGALKNQPIIGLRIIEGMVADGDGYSGGTIIDPATGKSYKCKITVEDGGAKLNVRGYVGTPMFGRTQVWVR